MQGFGAVVVPGCEDVFHAGWEPRVFALSLLVGVEGLATPSGRRVRELMSPVHYLQASYYERWLWSTERRLEGRGTIGEDDVDAWVDRLRGGDAPPRHHDAEQAARGRAAIVEAEADLPSATPRFRPGDGVRVKRLRPTGHTRCPRYVRGAAGQVDRVQGVEPFPDDGPGRGSPQPVYAVSFHSGELFGPTDEPAWTVSVDLYERYLEPA